MLALENIALLVFLLFIGVSLSMAILFCFIYMVEFLDD